MYTLVAWVVHTHNGVQHRLIHVMATAATVPGHRASGLPCWLVLLLLLLLPVRSSYYYPRPWPWPCPPSPPSPPPPPPTPAQVSPQLAVALSLRFPAAETITSE